MWNSQEFWSSFRKYRSPPMIFWSSFWKYRSLPPPPQDFWSSFWKYRSPSHKMFGTTLGSRYRRFLLRFRICWVRLYYLCRWVPSNGKKCFRIVAFCKPTRCCISKPLTWHLHRFSRLYIFLQSFCSFDVYPLFLKYLQTNSIAVLTFFPLFT